MNRLHHGALGALALLANTPVLPVASAFAPTGRVSTSLKCPPLSMGVRDALSRFRKKKDVEVTPIKIGDRLPEADVNVVQLLDPDDSEHDVAVPMSLQEVLTGKCILVGMPGAFTTTCTKEHLPGFIQNAGRLSKLGVDKICVVTTNDAFVNEAWAKDVGLTHLDPQTSSITFISDGDGALVKEMGLIEDMGFGVGIRSKRFAMIVEDGKAVHLETDSGMDDCNFSSAAQMVQILTPEPKVGTEDMGMEVDAKTAGLVVVGILAALFLLSSGGGGGGDSSGAVSLLETYG